jgi:glycosyltransferase 2 family protein
MMGWSRTTIIVPCALYDRPIVDFLRGVGGALARANLTYVALAIALHLAGLLVTGQRWRTIVAAFGRQISLFRATMINLAGIFVRNATPTTGLGGDASRVALLHLEGLTIPQATATFLYVRAAELPALAVVIALALPTIAGTVARTGGRVGLAVTAILIAVVWLARERFRSQLAALRVRAARLQIRRSAFAAAVGYATIAQAETTVRQIAVAASFGVPLTVQQSAAVTALGVAGGLVPTIGSVGAVEGSMVAALIMCGAGADAAVAITLVERAISYGLSSLLGAGAAAALGGRAALRLAAARGGNAATTG